MTYPGEYPMWTWEECEFCSSWVECSVFIQLIYSGGVFCCIFLPLPPYTSTPTPTTLRFIVFSEILYFSIFCMVFYWSVKVGHLWSIIIKCIFLQFCQIFYYGAVFLGAYMFIVVIFSCCVKLVINILCLF